MIISYFNIGANYDMQNHLNAVGEITEMLYYAANPDEEGNE